MLAIGGYIGLFELLLDALLLAFQVNAAQGADCGFQNLRG